MDLDISRLNLTIFWRKIMSKNIVPKVRFKSFDKVWESYQLSEYSTYRRGSFPQPYGNKEWYGGDNAMPFVQVVDVLENLRLVADTKQKISTLAQPMSVFVPSDSVIVTLQGSIGRVAITQYDAYVDRTILIFEDYNSQTNKEFWAYTIRNKFEIERQKAPGGTIKTITKEALSDFKVSIPEYTEQSAIGSLFRTLDDLLASYKDNLINYQSLKATMLSKMFPKAGQTVPEIRLDGFEGEWKVQSLKELARFSKGNGYTKSDLVNSGNEIILYGQLYTNYQTVISMVNTFVLETREKSVISKGGEVVVPASGESAEDISRASVIEKSGVIIGGDLNIIYPDENKVDSIFLALTISNGSQQKELIKRAQGKSVVHLRNNDLEKVVLHYPSMEEQQAIGACFSNLDNLINSHQEKISQLEILKKKLLQDMFI